MTKLLTLLMVAVGSSAAVADEKLGDSATTGRPWRLERGYRVLDLSKPPVVLDEPGRYALNRDWNVDLATHAPVIHVVADDVTLDFRGFAIAFGTEMTGISVVGDDTLLHGGSVFGDFEATGVGSAGARTVIREMQIEAYVPVTIGGDGASIRDSTLRGRFGTSLGAGAIADGNAFLCGSSGGFCLYVRSDARVIGNRIAAGGDGAVRVRGDNNLFANNIIDVPEDAGAALGGFFHVQGDGNLVSDNTVVLDVGVMHRAVFAIDGSGNVLDSNISVTHVAARNGVGITFAQDGNYYGDNRFGGVLEPVNLNGTVQVDWGGNVAY